jgi:hypothetical protein
VCVCVGVCVCVCVCERVLMCIGNEEAIQQPQTLSSWDGRESVVKDPSF